MMTVDEALQCADASREVDAPVGSYVMTESREEAKIRLRGFVEEYVALCNKYEAEVLVNSYGVHCVETDAGRTFAFKSVYPEWDDLAEQQNEEKPHTNEPGIPSAYFTLVCGGDFSVLDKKMQEEEGS